MILSENRSPLFGIMLQRTLDKRRPRGHVCKCKLHLHEGVMDIAARLDEIPRPFWIAFMILGFVFFWPIGLLILAYLIWSRRMGCSRHGRMGRWQNEMRDRFGGRHWQGPSSGNRAFDDYREETLRHLEDDQR